MKKVLDNSQRSKTVLTCLYILLTASVIMLISNFLQYRFLNQNIFKILAGAETNDQRQIIAAFILVVTQIAVIITFIQWFRRAYHNLHKAGIKHLRMSEGWAAGGWFVPIASWFIPVQIMSEIWQKTPEYGRSEVEGDKDSKSKKSLVIIGVWWTAWVCSNILGIITNQLTSNNPGMSDLKMITLISILTNFISILAILSLIKIIKESQVDQDRFLERWKEEDTEATFEISQSDDVLD